MSKELLVRLGVVKEKKSKKSDKEDKPEAVKK